MPTSFEGIAWSAGPGVPSTELWCFHKGYFDPVKYVVGAPIRRSFFLDKVEAGDEFIPPMGAAPSSLAMSDAIRAYARSRYYDVTLQNTLLSDWSVHVQYPFSTDTNSSPLKIEKGIYRVAQVDRPTGETPLAWVWALEDDGSREIWIYYRPDEVNGFHFVGNQPANEQATYESTQMKFTAINPPGYPWAALLSFGARVEAFKNATLSDDGTPVLSTDDLVVHDLHIQEMP